MRPLVFQPRDVHVRRAHDVLRALLLTARVALFAPGATFFFSSRAPRLG
jgi:hypothetical protein